MKKFLEESSGLALRGNVMTWRRFIIGGAFISL